MPDEPVPSEGDAVEHPSKKRIPSSSPSSAPPSSSKPHISVMRSEALAQFVLQPGDLAVDATLGAGGHAEDMLRAVAPSGRLLGFDVDPEALELARQHLAPLAEEVDVRLDLIKANFRTMDTHIKSVSPDQSPKAILADLGVSSMQFDRADRGFSFRQDAPLDLRMDPDLPRTGADLLQELPQEALADLLYHLGGERGSRRIARAIVQDRDKGRPIQTTGQLEGLVRRVLRVRGRARIHPATRTFQALRMAVNEELEALTEFLDTAPDLLAPTGTLAVITFHSGEDRLVKQAFKRWAATGRFQMMHKSVLRPAAEEVNRNPRSRSAKLRALRRA